MTTDVDVPFSLYLEYDFYRKEGQLYTGTNKEYVLFHLLFYLDGIAFLQTMGMKDIL